MALGATASSSTVSYFRQGGIGSLHVLLYAQKGLFQRTAARIAAHVACRVVHCHERQPFGGRLRVCGGIGFAEMVDQPVVVISPYKVGFPLVAFQCKQLFVRKIPCFYQTFYLFDKVVGGVDSGIHVCPHGFNIGVRRENVAVGEHAVAISIIDHPLEEIHLDIRCKYVRSRCPSSHAGVQSVAEALGVVQALDGGFVVQAAVWPLFHVARNCQYACQYDGK